MSIDLPQIPDALTKFILPRDQMEAHIRAYARDAVLADREGRGERAPLQGGLDNDALRKAWDKKLPGVEPKDRELTAFSLGVEVGFDHARDLERQDWYRVHYALAKHGRHPGRTDDHLADVIDRALTDAAPQPIEQRQLTDEQIDACMPLGMAPYSVLSGPEEIRRFARAVRAVGATGALQDIEPVAWLLESSSDRGIKRELSFSKPHVLAHWTAHPLYQHPPQPAENPEPVAWRFPVKVWIGEDRFETRWKAITTPDPDRDGLEPLYAAPQPVDRMRAAITAMIDGIERWLDTGIPAGPEESKAIYEQLCRAVGREPQP